MELEEISAAAAEVSEVPETTEVSTETDATTEVAPEMETENTESDPTDIVKSLPPRKKTAEERISELTWKRREAEREAEYWRKKATEREQPTMPPPSTDPSRPRLENFETTESYEDALLEWKLRQHNSQLEASKKKERESEALRQFNTKADRLRDVYDDFDEVVQAPVFTEAMRSVLLTSDNGPVMAYYLGRPENIKVAQRIAALPPSMQPYEIGKLETQLLLAQKTKKVPSAPPPINPVGTAGAVTVDEANMSDDEWYRREQEKRKAKIKEKYGG